MSEPFPHLSAAHTATSAAGVRDDASPSASPSAGRWARAPSWWLDHPAVDADALAALTALATFANRQGCCWPSQTTLAEKLKRSRAWVNKVIARLADAGLITVKDRWSDNGGRLSSLYVLTMDPLSAPANVPEMSSPYPVVDDGAPASNTGAPCHAEQHKQSNLKQIPDSHAYSRDAKESEGLLQSPTEDWSPSVEDLAWAQTRHRDIDINRHVEGFRLRCRAHGYRYRDLNAAWRAWLIQDIAAGKAPTAGKTSIKAPAQPTKKSPAEQSLNAWLAAADRLQSPPSPYYG